MNTNRNNLPATTGNNTGNLLPDHLPAGAKAFQAAVDGKLTADVWSEILDAQIAKAKGGDRGAAKFLVDYSGGVTSIRGATFVQENHHHHHYHESGDAPTPVSTDKTEISPTEYEARRSLHAQRVSARAGVGR